MSNDTDERSSQQKEDNIFRSSLLRYAGYANEVGESFRYQFPRLVIPSYIVAFGYCFADAATTGYDTYTKFHESNNSSSRSREVTTAINTGDVLLWQCLASVMIPGATINAIVKASRFAVARSPILLAASIKEWAPTAVGLSSISVIIHPIDAAVDSLLDNTTRRWFSMGGSSKDDDCAS